MLVTGPDFVAAPRLSPDGATLAWLQWNHPAMPWDAAELVVRDLATGEETIVAGGPGESVTEPRWRPDGSLWFLSDRTDWWNLYRWQPGHDIEAVVRTDADIGVPAWTFGTSRYAVLDDGQVVVARWRDGFDGLAVRGPDGVLTDLDLPFTTVGSVVAAGPDSVVVVAGSPTAEPGVHRIDLSGATPRVDTLRAPRDLGLAPDEISRPEAVRFPSVDGAGESRTGRALFYPPVNPRYRGPAGERPPLLVVIHGGPTSKALPGAGRRRAVLDQPRLRGGRRRLRRLVGLRPPVPRAAARRSGASSTSPTASPPPGRSRTAAASIPAGCASAAGRRAATRRWRRWPGTTRRSRPGPTTSASPISRRSPATRTSSRAATSTDSSGPTRRRARCTSSAHRSRTSSGSPAR